MHKIATINFEYLTKKISEKNTQEFMKQLLNFYNITILSRF